MTREYCNRCVMYKSQPSDKVQHDLEFDSQGLCNICSIHDKFEKRFTKNGKKKLDKIIDKVKEDGIGKKYDCILGISGGCDSSYCLHILREIYDLRVLTYHFDNTWSTTTAVSNIQKMVTALDVDYICHVADNDEYTDGEKAFLEASVTDQNILADINYATISLQLMDKYDINYSFEGHSYRTEGTVPFGWMYMDGKYIRSVLEQYGTLESYDSLPLMTAEYWLSQLEKRKGDRIRLLYYFDYKKEETKKFLSEKYDWEWYGGHHQENEYTKFVKTFVLPRKFGIDKRYVEFSALIRSGQMNRDEALLQLESLPEVDPEFIAYCKKRLNYTDKEFDKMMKKPFRHYSEFNTYIPYFLDNIDKLKELSEAGRLPSTFVEKLLIREQKLQQKSQ